MSIETDDIPTPSPAPLPTSKPSLESFDCLSPPKWQLSSLKLRREAKLQRRHRSTSRPVHSRRVSEDTDVSEAELSVRVSQELSEGVRVPVLLCKLKPSEPSPKPAVNYKTKTVLARSEVKRGKAASRYILKPHLTIDLFKRCRPALKS